VHLGLPVAIPERRAGVPGAAQLRAELVQQHLPVTRYFFRLPRSSRSFAW
jgi:hypothetical protein